MSADLDDEVGDADQTMRTIAHSHVTKCFNQHGLGPPECNYYLNDPPEFHERKLEHVQLVFWRRILAKYLEVRQPGLSDESRQVVMALNAECTRALLECVGYARMECIEYNDDF